MVPSRPSFKNKIFSESFKQTWKSQKDKIIKQRIIDEITKKNVELEERYSKLEEDYDVIEREKFDLQAALEELKEQWEKEKQQNITEKADLNNQIDVCKTHLRSLVDLLSDLLEYVLTRCLIGPPVTSRSQSSIMGGTHDFGNNMNNSYSTDLIYKVHDDDKRNHSELIKNLLISKLDVINKSVKDLNIENEINKIENWKMIDDLSEINSPINQNSFRASSRMDTESRFPPHFGGGSTHKTNSGSDYSHPRPFLKNDSYHMSFLSQESMEKLKYQDTENLTHRKSMNVEGSENKQMLHEDSMMNIGASKQDYDKKTSPIMGAPSIDDVEDERDHPKFEDEVGISRIKGNNTNSEVCDESAIEEEKSNGQLTSKDSLKNIVKSISFKDLYQPQEPAVMGLRLGEFTSVTLHGYRANEPGMRDKRQYKAKSMKKVALSENKNLEDSNLKKKDSEQSLILSGTAKEHLSEKGFGSFMNSDNEEENSKSVFSHDLDNNTGTFKFIFREPIIGGEGKFAKQKSMEFNHSEKCKTQPQLSSRM